MEKRLKDYNSYSWRKLQRIKNQKSLIVHVLTFNGSDVLSDSYFEYDELIGD